MNKKMVLLSTLVMGTSFGAHMAAAKAKLAVRDEAVLTSDQGVMSADLKLSTVGSVNGEHIRFYEDRNWSYGKGMAIGTFVSAFPATWAFTALPFYAKSGDAAIGLLLVPFALFGGAIWGSLLGSACVGAHNFVVGRSYNLKPGFDEGHGVYFRSSDEHLFTVGEWTTFGLVVGGAGGALLGLMQTQKGNTWEKGREGRNALVGLGVGFVAGALSGLTAAGVEYLFS